MGNKNVLAATAAVIGAVMIISSAALAKSGKGNDHDDDVRLENHRSVGSTLEVHIFDSGRVLVRGAKVTSVGSSTVNAATTWGTAVLNWTVQIDSSTNKIKRIGGSATLDEFSVGDFVSFEGNLVTTAPQLTVQAKTLKNWSIQKQRVSFFGTVKNIATTSASFIVAAEGRGDVTVMTNSDTEFEFSGRSGDGTFADLAIGGKVHVRGLLNTVQNTLTADRVKIFVDRTTSQRVFEGKLQSLASTTPPTSIGVTIGGTNHTVNIAADTSVLNRDWARVPLSSFRIGDTIRIYGAREGTAIEATVVRDVSIP